MSDTMVTVTALHTYPIKSCAGVALSSARLSTRGLEHDRDYMLVADDNSFLSQRQIPELAFIEPTIGESAITLHAPGMAPIEVPLEVAVDDTRLVEATVFGDPIAGQHLDPPIDEWFTAFLPRYRGNRGFRLLRVRPDIPRLIDAGYRRNETSNQVGFADGHAILLASEPSLAQLNREMDAPVPMNRFRPNVVVDGPDLVAYDEDYWTHVRIGPLTAFVVKGSDRCEIPDIDQDTAQVGKNVRRALVTRKGANAFDPSNTGVFFAQNLAHVYEPGVTINVGDQVEVISRSTTPNVVLRKSTRPRPAAAA